MTGEECSGQGVQGSPGAGGAGRCQYQEPPYCAFVRKWQSGNLPGGGHNPIETQGISSNQAGQRGWVGECVPGRGPVVRELMNGGHCDQSVVCRRLGKGE